MKSRTLVLGIFLAILFKTSTLAQTLDLSLNADYYNYLNPVIGIFFIPENFVEGSYLKKDGQKGIAKMRFNVKTGMPERADGENIYTLSSVVSFSLKLNEKLTINFKNGFKPFEKNTENTYYQINYDGRVKFINDFRLNETISSDYTNPGAKAFIIDKKYYFVDEIGDLNPLKNKKALLKIDTFDKYYVREFIQSNSIKFNRWNDVSKVIDFLFHE